MLSIYPTFLQFKDQMELPSFKKIKQVTQGCTGTYALMHFFPGEFDYSDHHQRNPEMPEYVEKVFYVFCNPFDYVISSFGRSDRQEGIQNFNISHTKQCDGDYKYFLANYENSINLKSYLSDPYDAYFYKDHTLGYMNHSERSYDLLILKYDSLKKSGIDALVSFLNSKKNPNDFVFQQRKSDWNNQPEEIKKLLISKYGDVMDWYNSFPDVSFYEKD